MELNIAVYNKLIDFVDNTKKNKNYEFEARFWNVTEQGYNKLFQKFTFSKENNGLACKYEMQNILDVILDKNSVKNNFDSIRMSIYDINKIKLFWLNSSLKDIVPIFIEKEKLDKIDDHDYNMRFSLNNELPQNNLLNKNKELLTSTTYEKVYRLKNRYSIRTPDDLFLIDMTSVKMGVGKTFKESNLLKENSKYEVEIEFIGKDTKLDNDTVVKKLIEYSEIILKILQNSTVLLSTSTINRLKNEYFSLIKSDHPNDFIAASPVTVHRENLLKGTKDNIQNRYAVTLKADGYRNFLFVSPSDSKIYIFDNNFEFKETGYEDPSWGNTLIEGEYIDNGSLKELYMYDILFSKGEDVRKRYLSDGKSNSRLEILEAFLKSTTRTLNKLFDDESKTIQLKNKKYLQSVRNDGSDIFQKIKEIWDSRKFNTFYSDGVILVPRYEYYPLRGGSWHSLFKWKPPQLNTIDFLIKIVKDDENKDIKSPYIEVDKSIGGKADTYIRQYKSIRLYVKGQKPIYNRDNNQKRRFKNIPVLFNPYGNDDKNSERFNLAKIFIEDDEKIYAFDPITNTREELYDDIIVEFSYDNSREDGFKWLPHKIRKDKTIKYKNGEDEFGNGERTAIDIFKAINLPVTEEMITTGEIPVTEDSELHDLKPYYTRTTNETGSLIRYPYQDFHNHYIKYQLLYFSSPTYINEFTTGFHGKILDLCCGNGADFNKIEKAKYEEVVGMDIDYNNIKQAQERYKSKAVKRPKAYYVRGDSGKLIFPNQASGFTEADKVYTKKFIPTKYIFDTVSMQFCFHYFFENEITMRTVIQNINDNLKIGGFVIGTTFDGSRIYDKLKSVNSISGKKGTELLWKIDKKYTGNFSFTSKKANFGKQIDVLVKTIGNVWPEYLVNFNYLDKIMEDYGFIKIFVKPFEEYYNELMEGKNLMNLSDKDLEQHIDKVKRMSDAEKEFSFFSSAFMYKKERNSSDALMKKLAELIEKKDKLRKKNVFKVDKDDEELIEYVEEL